MGIGPCGPCGGPRIDPGPGGNGPGPPIGGRGGPIDPTDPLR